jgi:hypothetical protein
MRYVVVVFVAACSPNFGDDVLPGDASAFRPDATNDSATADVDAEAGVVFNGGGPFLCNDCICDGTLRYCEIADAGFVVAADANACTEASACHQFPITCLPKPTCACLENFLVNCTCGVDPSGNGIVITCP